jgi:AraC-like DNA-binding protein
MWQVFEPELRRRLTELEASASTSDRVCAVLLELLPSGQGSIDIVASRLAMSKRTLQRRLEEDGETFQSLINQTRESLARHYLKQTTLSNGEISFLLGFEDPNSFFRAFRPHVGS